MVVQVTPAEIQRLGGQCSGWAYETCDRPAEWGVVIGENDGQWEAWGVCGAHLQRALGSVTVWLSQPEVVVVVELSPGEPTPRQVRSIAAVTTTPPRAPRTPPESRFCF